MLVESEDKNYLEL